MPAAGKSRLETGDVDVTTLCSARMRERRTLSSDGRHDCLDVVRSLGTRGLRVGSSILATPVHQDRKPHSHNHRRILPRLETAKIQIAPVIGSPDNVARDLQAQLRFGDRQRGMTVATAANATANTSYAATSSRRAKRPRPKSPYLGCHGSIRQARPPHHRRRGCASAPEKTHGLRLRPEVVQRISRQDGDAVGNWLPVPQAFLSPPIRRR